MKDLGFVTQHEIRIKPTCNKGFVIKIGCATVVAASDGELLELLSLYINDPKHWEKKYNNLEGAPCIEASNASAPPDAPETATDPG